jgi:hypothetical protein
MRKLLNLLNGDVVGEVPWLEVNYILNKTNLLKNAIMNLLLTDLNSIDNEVKTLKKLLYNYFKKSKISSRLTVGVSDTVVEKHDYVCKGVLKDSKGQPLSSHKIWFYDKDNFSLDDYLGSVITDKQGFFEFSFNNNSFRDFGEKLPKFMIKVFRFNKDKFDEILEEDKLNDFKYSFNNNKYYIDFNEIIISD